MNSEGREVESLTMQGGRGVVESDNSQAQLVDSDFLEVPEPKFQIAT